MLDANLDTVFVAKEGKEDEAVFLKERSVFADFREDTEEFLQKCLNKDMEYSKIEKLFKKDITGATL